MGLSFQRKIFGQFGIPLEMFLLTRFYQNDRKLTLPFAFFTVFMLLDETGSRFRNEMEQSF